MTLNDQTRQTPSTKDCCIIESVRDWVQTVVVDMNLCPFAKHPLLSNRVRFRVSYAVSEGELLGDLLAECALLGQDPSIETSLLIHPYVLQEFSVYNQFLDQVEGLLIAQDLEGIYQVASFHPQYQFAVTQPQDAENYTNRTPYPLLHLLREASLKRAIARYPDAEKIPQRNIKKMQALEGDQLEIIKRASRAPEK